MPTDLKKTSLIIIGAEHFQVPIEETKAHLIQSSLLYDTFALSTQTDSLTLKIAHQRTHHSKLLTNYSLDTEFRTRLLLSEKTKFKLPGLIEFNNSHDLLPNDYLIMEPLQSTFLPENFQINLDFKNDVDTYLEECYQLANPTFSHLQEELPFEKWEEFFEYRWLLLLKELEEFKVFNQEEIEYAEMFYQSLQEVLEEDYSPVLINLGLTNHQFSHANKILDSVNDFSQCLWATPEFELAKRDFLKSIETPKLIAYKQSVKEDLTIKARYFIYLVYFLLEDCLLQHTLGQSPTHYQNNKILGLTLMKSALQQ